VINLKDAIKLTVGENLCVPSNQVVQLVQWQPGAPTQKLKRCAALARPRRKRRPQEDAPVPHRQRGWASAVGCDGMPRRMDQQCTAGLAKMGAGTYGKGLPLASIELTQQQA